jgi:primase-polymerase (primpol)-like protein
MGSKLAPLAQQIAITGKTPSDHKTSDIYQNAQTGTSVKWYEAHRADFKELLDNLYKNHMPSQVTEDEIRKNAEAAHTALAILAGLMHSMHATGAMGSQERNAILQSAKHARKNLRRREHQPLIDHVASAARMAAALRLFSDKNGKYDDITDEKYK